MKAASIFHAITFNNNKYIKRHQLFKYGFNLNPLYRRTTGRVLKVSKDLMQVTMRIKLSRKNKNIFNVIFGGSLFSSVDPFPMSQLILLLGKEYVIWDKAANIRFKRPADVDLYADFNYNYREIDKIKEQVAMKREIDFDKITYMTNKDKSIVYCEVTKTLYIAEKDFYKQKMKQIHAKQKLKR